MVRHEHNKWLESMGMVDADGDLGQDSEGVHKDEGGESKKKKK